MGERLIKYKAVATDKKYRLATKFIGIHIVFDNSTGMMGLYITANNNNGTGIIR